MRLSLRTKTLQIRTPEGIIFALPLAGPVTRFLAWAIDMACLLVASNILAPALSLLKLVNRDAAEALGILFFFLLQIGYGMVAEWFWRGQTLGKKILHLRVMDAHGLRLRGSQIVLRNLLRFVDGLPALNLVGGLSCVFSRHAQRLGDFAANTVVVRNQQLREPDFDQLLRGKYNSLLQHPHLAARLRQRLSPEEASLILSALLRRDELEAQPRVTLFQNLAAYFKQVVEFPQEALDGVADEQYVRNVADIVYRK
jgi:uncharacterized RDD family membrane protein YckC